MKILKRVMAEEYILPPDEGPVPKPYIQLYKMNQKELNINVGSLEKRAFYELSDWRIIDRGEVDLAFRIGLKIPFLDNRGKISTLLALFGALLYNASNPPSEKRYSEEYTTLYNMLETIVIQNIPQCGNLMGILLEPPQYMLKELKEKLKE